MEKISLGKKSFASKPSQEAGQFASAVSTGEQALRKKIRDNPGVALAISAAVGVLIACLIKRR